MSISIEYREGGNPPVAPGLFAVTHGGKQRNINGLVRLAFWPAHIAPTDNNINAVIVELVWKRDDESRPVTRDQIADLFLWRGRGIKKREG
jgi:hypothetical protein